jgi:MFS family permease
MPEFTKTFGTLSSTIHGVVVSSILIPAATASFFAGHLADKVGRGRAIAFGGLIYGIGAALEAGSVHLAMLIIGRALAGVGEGLFLSTITV